MSEDSEIRYDVFDELMVEVDESDEEMADYIMEVQLEELRLQEFEKERGE